MSLRQRSYNMVNEERIFEASEEIEVNGKMGVWRRVANHNVFFPSDGSPPIGIPKLKSKKQEKREVEKAKKKVAFFNGLFKKLGFS